MNIMEIEGLFKKSYTNYSAQFKLDVLNYMNDTWDVYQMKQLRFLIFLLHAMIRKWRIHFETQGVDALESKKKGRPSMKKENKKKQKQTPTEGSIEALQAEIEHLTNGECVFKKVECLSSKQGKITKQDKAQVVYELRNEFPVKALIKTCRYST